MTSERLPTGRPLRVACVGGGQLGRMMALEAPRIGITMSFLDPSGVKCPAAQVVPHDNISEGSLKDPAAIHSLVQKSDVVTVEIEHVGVETLEQLEKEGVNVQPSARVLTIIRDKYLQKVSWRDVEGLELLSTVCLGLHFVDVVVFCSVATLCVSRHSIASVSSNLIRR